MEISQIRSTLPFMFQGNEKEAVRNAPKNAGDTVDIQGMQLLADEEVEGVLNETINMIGSDSSAALAVHSGLSESRVFALLGL